MLEKKRILVSNWLGLGDLVMHTSALRRLKEMYPDCELSLVVSSRNRPIIERLPYIDHVYTFDKGVFLGRYRAAVHLWNQDYVIFTQWMPQLAWPAYFFRVSHRAGVCKEKYKHSGLFHVCLPPDGDEPMMYEAEYAARRLSEALGVSLAVDGVCDVSEPLAEEKASVNAKLKMLGMEQGVKYMVLAPFAKTEWDMPSSIAKALMRYVWEKHRLACVLVNETETLWEGEEPFSEPYVYNLCGRTSLMEMVALFQGASLAVTMDSGPMHIACACRTKTVAVFSVELPSRWAPKKYCWPVSVNAPCAPCTREQKRNCVHGRVCIETITAEMIEEKIDDALQI